MDSKFNTSIDLTVGFLTRVENYCEEMQKAVQSNDLAKAQIIAHQLRGAAGLYGFPTMTTLAETLEEILQTEAATTSSLPKICELSKLSREFKKMIRDSSPSSPDDEIADSRGIVQNH